MKAGRKPAKRVRKPYRKTRKAPKQTAHAPFHAADIEELLIKSLLDPQTPSEKGIAIEDLIYSMTPNLSKEAYKFGYSIGKTMSLSSKGGNAPLIRALSKLGFRNISYQPFRDAVVIKSMSRSHAVTKVNARIHFLESGMIAGFMSGHSGEKITTVEKECMYNGDSACRFVSHSGRSFEDYTAPQPGAVTSAIAEKIRMTKFNDRSGMEYHLLPFLPMLKEPLRTEVAKVLYIAGMELASNQIKNDANDLIRNAARYFGTSSETAVINPKSASVKLEYKAHNSNRAFIELSTAMISGFIKKRYSKEPSVYINVDKNMNYIVDISTAVRK